MEKKSEKYDYAIQIIKNITFFFLYRKNIFFKYLISLKIVN